MMQRLGFCLVVGLLMATLAGATPAPKAQEMAPGFDVTAWLNQSEEAPMCLEGPQIDGVGYDQGSDITYLSCTTYLECVEGYIQCLQGCYYFPCGSICDDWYADCLANVC